MRQLPWLIYAELSNDTGHQAIALAYNIGFKKIVLIGFDMNPQTKQTHWHNEHKTPTNTHMYEHTMIPGLERMAKELANTDVRVYNINRESNLKCFEFADLEEFL